MAVPVVAINLHRNAGRRERALSAFGDAGVNLTLHRAIDGAALDLTQHENYQHALRLKRYGVDMTSTEIGCYLSHLAAIQYCFDAGFERAVIIEDDVHPNAHFAEALEQLETAPRYFEFVRLIGTRPRPFLEVAELTDDVRVVWPNHGMCGAQAYYITRPAMQKILSIGKNIAVPFDMLVDRYWRLGFTIFALDPFVVFDASAGKSDIGARYDAWKERPRPWLRARLKAQKFIERLQRTAANANARASLAAWRRQHERV